MKQEREIKEHMLGEAIAIFRAKAFKVITSDNAPNIYPHTLMLLSSMVHGAAQALAIMTSKSAQDAEPDEEGKVTVESLVPTAVTNDTITFAALMMLRTHTVIPGKDGGVITEISPDIIAGAIDDFKKLRNREPSDLNTLLTEIAGHSLGLPTVTHQAHRGSHLN